MKTIKLNDSNSIPKNYSGIIERKNGKGWYKDGELHREDGPAWIRYDGYKIWFLDGTLILSCDSNLNFSNKTIVSKSQHPKYPLVQVWKIKNIIDGKIQEQIMIPGMELYFLSLEDESKNTEEKELKTMKLKVMEDFPVNYTGIIEWEDGDVSCYKNGSLHKEDGPAYISKNGYQQWWLDGELIWSSVDKLDLKNKEIVSKTTHSKYPTVQVWEIKNNSDEKVFNQVVIPGMEEYIQE